MIEQWVSSSRLPVGRAISIDCSRVSPRSSTVVWTIHLYAQRTSCQGGGQDGNLDVVGDSICRPSTKGHRDSSTTEWSRVSITNLELPDKENAEVRKGINGGNPRRKRK